MASRAVEQYLSPKQIAERLSVSRSRAYEIAAECECVKFGRNVRVLASSFQRWIEQHTVAPVPKVMGLTRPLDPRRTVGKRKRRHFVSGITGDGSTIRRMAPRT